MSGLTKYRMTFILGVQQSLEYRFNFFIEIASVILPVVIQFFMWSAIYAHSSEPVYGYTYEQMIIYSVLAAIIAKVVRPDLDYLITSDIKEGGLNKYLVKPVGYFGFRFFSFLGQKVFFLIASLVLIVIFIAVIGRVWDLRVELGRSLLFLLALILALCLNFLISYNLSAVSFWLTEISYLFGIVNLLIMIMSGGIFPPEIFGPAIYRISQYLPFIYTISFPANIINDRLSGELMAKGLAMQFGWIIVLSLTAQLIWGFGYKKYTAAGG